MGWKEWSPFEWGFILGFVFPVLATVVIVVTGGDAFSETAGVLGFFIIVPFVTGLLGAIIGWIIKLIRWIYSRIKKSREKSLK